MLSCSETIFSWPWQRSNFIFCKLPAPDWHVHNFLRQIQTIYTVFYGIIPALTWYLAALHMTLTASKISFDTSLPFHGHLKNVFNGCFHFDNRGLVTFFVSINIDLWSPSWQYFRNKFVVTYPTYPISIIDQEIQDPILDEIWGRSRRQCWSNHPFYWSNHYISRIRAAWTE